MEENKKSTYKSRLISKDTCKIQEFLNYFGFEVINYKNKESVDNKDIDTGIYLDDIIEDKLIDGCLEMFSKHNKSAIIICDSMDYNSTYVVDLFNKTADQYRNLLEKENVELFYIDDVYLKVEMFRKHKIAPLWQSFKLTDNALSIIEKKETKPAILLLHPNKSVECFFENNLTILNEKHIEHIVKMAILKNEVIPETND